MIGIGRMIGREIAYRRGAFAAAVCGIVLAVATLVGSLGLLRAHDALTEREMERLRLETVKRTEQLQDDYRKIVLKLGFNVYIVPEGARMDDWYAADFGAMEMPESYVQTLADAGVISINHLLPSLSKRVPWPAHDMNVLLTGVRGEVTIAGQKRKMPLLQPVAPGEIVLGYAVAKTSGAAEGDSLELLGRTFTVREIHPFRGNNDDVTVWIDLVTAQEMLDKPGRINAIQAINCLAPQCYPDADGIPSVREEIERVLPGTTVLVDIGKAVTRIDARKRAAQEAREQMEQEAARLAAVRARMEQYASYLTPSALLVACLWVGFLSLANVRGRLEEIGILRALGVGTGGILRLFLGRSIVTGLVGAPLGCALGLAVASTHGDVGLAVVTTPLVVGIALVGAPVLAVLAAWLPALAAAQQDPAAVLVDR